MMRLCNFLAALVFLSCAGAAWGQSSYVVIDLGTFGGATSYAYDINENGDACGQAWTGNGNIHHGFYYDDGAMTDIGALLSYSTSEAHGMNDLGEIVGFSYATGSPYYEEHPFLYSGGTMIDLGTLGGHDAGAWAINNHGQVVGMSELTYGTYEDYHAFLYENGTMTDLGTLGGRNSWAFDINDNGQVVGRSRPAVGGEHAFLYENDTMVNLGVPSGGVQSAAYGINNNGDIVGDYDASAGSWRPFLYTDGQFVDLGSLGGQSGCANDINESGQVVGRAATSEGFGRAFLWEEGTMYDLNTLIPSDSGWMLFEAHAINDNGYIVGSGKNPSGDTHAFILVPEPATLSLLSLGGLMLMRRRK